MCVKSLFAHSLQTPGVSRPSSSSSLRGGTKRLRAEPASARERPREASASARVVRPRKRSRVVAGGGTVRRARPDQRKFRDGDSVRVKLGPHRGHVGVVQSIAGGKYTVRLQDGSECVFGSFSLTRTSL